MLERRLLFLGVIVLASLGGLWALTFWRQAKQEQPDEPADEISQHEGPTYRNTRPDVEYVGDEVCSRCHQSIATSESFDPSTQPAFDAVGLHYEVTRQGEKIIHRESRRDSQGKVIDAREAEVQYALGSGTRGRSFLVNLDGELYLSPVAWYSQAKRWDLSPGYAQLHSHFERPVKADCLFCHCNRVKPVADTVNRYEKPIFRGHAIGCERCHGPGAIHVREQEAGEQAPITSIVQPGKLSPALRDAVCEQCHLHGILRVPRQGHEEFDYRPGLPLHDFLAVFVRAQDVTFDNRAVSQVEQMSSSKCYVKSKGKLGCISCHDPHGLPRPEEGVAFYRSRCLECHGSDIADCNFSAQARRERNQDNCVACHMPRFATADVAHTSVTDHRILAHPEKPRRTDGTVQVSPLQSPLVHFHQNQLPKGRSLDRELGLALTQVGLTERPDFEPTTWRAFLRFALDGLPAASVGEELGMSESAAPRAQITVGRPSNTDRRSTRASVDPFTIIRPRASSAARLRPNH